MPGPGGKAQVDNRGVVPKVGTKTGLRHDEVASATQVVMDGTLDIAGSIYLILA